MADATLIDESLKRLMAQDGSSDFNMTKEEAERIKGAFEKPEFRKMFQEYMEEISDPKHRQENEEYLKQLESEQHVPKGMQLTRPEPGFVAKFKTDKGKVFINICQTDVISKPTKNSTPKGVQWSVPNMLGQPRMEKDAKGEQCLTFDVAFHPDALVESSKLAAFQRLLVNVARDAVVKGYKQRSKADLNLPEAYHILRNVKCLGGRPGLMYYKEDQAGTRTAATPASAASKSAQAKSTQQRAGSQGDKQENKQARAKAADSPAKAAAKGTGTPPVPKLPAGVVEPVTTIVHRGTFDLSNYMRGRQAPKNRPKELVVRIELPELKSARGVELDVEERSVRLQYPGKYALQRALPFAVLHEKAKAKFHKDARRLEVTVPVAPPTEKELGPWELPPKEEAPEADKEEGNKDAAKKEERKEVAGKEAAKNKDSTEEPTKEEAKKTPNKEISKAAMKKEAVAEGQDAGTPQAQAEAASACSKAPAALAAKGTKSNKGGSAAAAAAPMPKAPTPVMAAATPVAAEPPAAPPQATKTSSGEGAKPRKTDTQGKPQESVEGKKEEANEPEAKEEPGVISRERYSGNEAEGLPHLRWRQNSMGISIVLYVPQVDKASVQGRISEDGKDVKLEFTAAEDGKARAYGFIIHMYSAVGPYSDGSWWDVASDNMVLLLKKAGEQGQRWPRLGAIEALAPAAAGVQLPTSVMSGSEDVVPPFNEAVPSAAAAKLGIGTTSVAPPSVPSHSAAAAKRQQPQRDTRAAAGEQQKEKDKEEQRRRALEEAKRADEELLRRRQEEDIVYRPGPDGAIDVSPTPPPAPAAKKPQKQAFRSVKATALYELD